MSINDQLSTQHSAGKRQEARGDAQHSALSTQHCRRRLGYTLVELVVSIAIMSILMAGIASAVLIASHAMPGGQTPLETAVEAIDVVDQIASELLYATTITENTASAVTFTVADRSHGDSGPETIRYAWSGTPGDPLTRQYNGGTTVTVCQDVQDFSLACLIQAMQLQDPPTVLLVVNNAVSMSESDHARETAMESWDYDVSLISASESQASFDSAVTTADVAYISETVLSWTLETKLRDAPIGVVNEEGQLYEDFGISEDADGVYDGDAIEITDNAHEITSVFDIGTLTICSAQQELLVTWHTLADGAQVLAYDPRWGDDLLVTVEYGGGLYGGGQAAARRVRLPWGNSGGFDFSELNSDGLELMRRSIVWAAAPIAYTSVRIALQPSADSAGRVETQTRILNAPEVNGP